MTKEDLFKKFSIDESHAKWDDRIDRWMSIELYRIMHDGRLPDQTDFTLGWVCGFMVKCDDIKFMAELMKREDWGSLFLTAKRMIYRYADLIAEGIPSPPAT